MDTVISTVGLIDENAAKVLELSKAMYEENVKDGLSAVTGLKAGENELPKGVVYAADVFGIWNDYFQKKEQLEADYEHAGVNSMVSWFYSSNIYDTDNDKPVLYYVGIYDGYVIEAIKEWYGRIKRRKSGIKRLCAPDFLWSAHHGRKWCEGSAAIAERSNHR